ncbi:MAG: hypothetical protein OXU77_04205 [Gammaproteobacteria bacterium]|nr:hypothetical protein [Gammaproteobacteria bacterium]MDE0443415.1 hypothetical protein [Gammaproteobacteria bacterium]
MPTLNIKRADGAPDFEEYMRVAELGETTLRLPNNIYAAGSLGRSVSLAQLVATWAQTSPSRRVRTYLDPHDKAAHKDFVSHLHGLAAAYYAEQVTASDETTDIRRALLEAAVPRIRAMSVRQFDRVGKGPRAELLFVHGARRQFHSAAYRHPPSFAELMDPQSHGNLIVSARQMNALLVTILRGFSLSGKDWHRVEELLDPRDAPLGNLLHEAFRNTAEHAYLDADGKVPSRGLRCIVIATRRAQPHELEAHAFLSGAHPHVDEYFTVLRHRASRVGRRLVFILELSVLDTGPGFAATIQHASGASDLERVRHCFVDYASSKPGPNSGLGLGRILRHIGAVNGFVRFRTSTTEACFTRTPASSADDPCMPNLVSGLPKAVGTALTVGIPLSVSL